MYYSGKLARPVRRYRVEVPIRRFPSQSLVVREHLFVEARLKRCPQCGSPRVRFLRAAVIPPRAGQPYPVGGDLLVYECPDCGLLFHFEFLYRRPAPEEAVFDDPLQAFRELLDLRSSHLPPEYRAFSYALLMILDDCKERKEFVSLVTEILREFIRYKRKLEGFSADNRDLGKYLLLLSFICHTRLGEIVDLDYILEEYEDEKKLLEELSARCDLFQRVLRVALSTDPRYYYSRIYEWHRRNRDLIYERLKGRSRDDPYISCYQELVNAMPKPEEATLEDIALICCESIAGLMEWAYWLEDREGVPIAAYAYFILITFLDGFHGSRTWEYSRRSRLYPSHSITGCMKRGVKLQ